MKVDTRGAPYPLAALARAREVDEARASETEGEAARALEAARAERADAQARLREARSLGSREMEGSTTGARLARAAAFSARREAEAELARAALKRALEHERRAEQVFALAREARAAATTGAAVVQRHQERWQSARVKAREAREDEAGEERAEIFRRFRDS